MTADSCSLACSGSENADRSRAKQKVRRAMPGVSARTGSDVAGAVTFGASAGYWLAARGRSPQQHITGAAAGGLCGSALRAFVGHAIHLDLAVHDHAAFDAGAGWRVLARRIRKKYGGLKIY